DGFHNLMRRVEVALAWASTNHSSHQCDLPIAHGEDALRKFRHADTLDLDAAATTGGYMPRVDGFFGSTYQNSLLEVGLVVVGGPLESVAAANGLPVAHAWRGLFLRHYLVTAWRRLWGEVVLACDGRTTNDVIESVIDQLPDVTVSQFVDEIETELNGRLVR